MDLPRSLDHEVLKYSKAAFAPATQKAYATHRRAYLSFCKILGIQPIPATTSTLCRYVAYLARRLRFNSIKQYINIIRLFHLEWGFKNPLQDNFKLSMVLRGVRRERAVPPARKLPITPYLLARIRAGLNLRNPREAGAWAAALIMFFSLLRRSNVLPNSLREFNPEKHLRRKDLTISRDSAQLTTRWSKTNQFKERRTVIPLPRTNNTLCPVVAAFQAFRLTPNADPWGPAFGALTSTDFVDLIRRALAPVVKNTADYAGHSFRRGGACWAFEAGASIEEIRLLGDWKSDAYTAYIIPSALTLAKTTLALAKALPEL